MYVLTGGTRGLGYASRELVADGANVAGVAMDNSAPQSPQQLIATARELIGGFDGILVSVGGPPAGNVAHNTDER